MARSFQYLRPESLDSACEMKARLADRAALWAGGTDLLLQWQRGAVDFESCIDLSGLDGLATVSKVRQLLGIAEARNAGSVISGTQCWRLSVVAEQ